MIIPTSNWKYIFKTYSMQHKRTLSLSNIKEQKRQLR